MGRSACGGYIPVMAVASLSFLDNGTLHGDLVLLLDHFERRCDSFYLAHDNNLLPEERDAEKVRLVLVRLLEEWRQAVAVLGAGEVTYLPYEFDDQATGWLHVSAFDDDDVEVLPVCSALEGWAFSPTSFIDEEQRIGKTTPVWKNLPSQRMSHRELLDQIEASIDAASTSGGRG
jgi:hypothetical protein